MTHAQTLRQFSDWCDMAGLVAGDRYLIVNPFFHMFGYKAGCLASLMQGATIIPKAVFDVDDLLRTVDAESVTVLPGPPTLYQSILDHPDRDRFDLSSLRVAVTGAADIPVELIRRLHEELPFRTIITGYGLTEAGTVTGTGPDDDFDDHRDDRRARPARTRDPHRRRRRGGATGRGAGRGARPRLQRDARLPRRPGGDRARRRRRRAGCTRVTSGRSTSGDASASSDGRRTCSSSAASTPTPPRSRTCCSPTLRSAGSRWWGCRTSGSARSAWPSSCVAPGAALRPEELIDWARAAMANYKVPRAVEIVDESSGERRGQGREGGPARPSGGPARVQVSDCSCQRSLSWRRSAFPDGSRGISSTKTRWRMRL